MFLPMGRPMHFVRVPAPVDDDRALDEDGRGLSIEGAQNECTAYVLQAWSGNACCTIVYR